MDVWSFFVTLIDVFHVNGFPWGVHTEADIIPAIEQAAKDSNLGLLRMMAVVDPDRRPSAADMLNQMFGGEGRTTTDQPPAPVMVEEHQPAMVVEHQFPPSCALSTQPPTAPAEIGTGWRQQEPRQPSRVAKRQHRPHTKDRRQGSDPWSITEAASMKRRKATETPPTHHRK
ncbi:MAG: hypothetical protein M1823_001808 [Watsoniomyces obsoletus]|nr:MAG: hypothetical protein M1823_001808 [Watsoniomyces obsoletus]